MFWIAFVIFLALCYFNQEITFYLNSRAEYYEASAEEMRIQSTIIRADNPVIFPPPKGKGVKNEPKP